MATTTFLRHGRACPGLRDAEIDRAAHLQRGDKRGRAENPASTWTNRFLAATYVSAGRADEGRRTLDTFMRHYPGLTIGEVRSSLPEQAGMQP